MGATVTLTKKKKSQLLTLIRESILVLSLCALGEMLAGIFLESGISYLPGLLVLVPAILQLRGTVSGSFSARVSTALHIGTIKPQFRNNTRSFYVNIYANIFITVISLFLAAFVSTLVMEILRVRHIDFLLILTITFIAGLISGLMQIFISIFSGFLVFNRGLDPDLIVFPLLSVIGDILTIFFLMIVTNIFLSFMGWEKVLFAFWGVFQ